MSKRLLVIDDRGCAFCPAALRTFNRNVIGCEGMDGRRLSESLQIQINNHKANEGVKPSWCPLKDVPEHKLDWRTGENGYESGWNDCLDVIGVE